MLSCKSTSRRAGIALGSVLLLPRRARVRGAALARARHHVVALRGVGRYAGDSTAPRPKNYDLVRAVPGATARAAVFPVGKRGQKLAEGTPVVSERAIKHVRELAHLAARPNTKARAGTHLRVACCAVLGCSLAC